MNNTTRNCWIFASLLLATAVAGCQSQQGEEFQTFKEKQRSGYDPAAPIEENVAPDESEPILAEVVPEPVVAISSAEPPVDALAPVNLADGSDAADILRANAAVSSPNTPKDLAPAGPRQVELLVTNRTFRPEGPKDALRVNYDDLDLLKVLNMDPVTVDAVEKMPDWLTQLDGQLIRIRGFMFPTFESTGIERFVLARDAEKCCFGPDAKVYDLIAVEMKPGKTCDYIHLRPFDVVGTLHIDMQADGEEPLGLYRIDNAELVTR